VSQAINQHHDTYTHTVPSCPRTHTHTHMIKESKDTFADVSLLREKLLRANENARSLDVELRC